MQQILIDVSDNTRLGEYTTIRDALVRFNVFLTNIISAVSRQQSMEFESPTVVIKGLDSVIDAATPVSEKLVEKDIYNFSIMNADAYLDGKIEQEIHAGLDTTVAMLAATGVDVVFAETDNKYLKAAFGDTMVDAEGSILETFEFDAIMSTTTALVDVDAALNDMAVWMKSIDNQYEPITSGVFRETDRPVFVIEVVVDFERLNMLEADTLAKIEYKQSVVDHIKANIHQDYRKFDVKVI